MKNSFKIISEKFEDVNNKEVEGLTVIVDGRLSRVFEILKEEDSYNNNSEVLREIISLGLNKILEKKRSFN